MDATDYFKDADNWYLPYDPSVKVERWNPKKDVIVRLPDGRLEVVKNAVGQRIVFGCVPEKEAGK